MIRPPPGSTALHSVRASAPQAKRSTCTSSSGRIGRRTRGGVGAAAAVGGADDVAGFAEDAAGFAAFGGGVVAAFGEVDDFSLDGLAAAGLDSFAGVPSVFAGAGSALEGSGLSGAACAFGGSAFGGSAFAGAGSAFGVIAFTALLQAAERLAMFCCRHCRDARPPGGTLVQCAM